MSIVRGRFVTCWTGDLANQTLDADTGRSQPVHITFHISSWKVLIDEPLVVGGSWRRGSLRESWPALPIHLEAQNGKPCCQ